jgi:hypothetical protein
MNQMMQLVFPALQQACMAVGNFEPLNNALRAWGKPQEIDVDRLGILFPQPPPPQAAPPAAAPPPGAAA